MPITVAIVEDEPQTRECLVRLLDRSTRVRCLATYPTGEDAVQDIPRTKPDVVLVDINLPKMSGIECVAKLTSVMPDLHIMMLTTYEDRDQIFDSLRAGASGYLLKKAGYTGLIRAIDEVCSGGSPMTAQVARLVVRHFHRITKPASDVEQLTSREQELLGLLAKGFSYKEISQELSISGGTVNTHVKSIYRKLHVQSRMQAAAKFFGQS
jgi:DNA-binding NarL/FixJ family response regulator